MKVLIAEDDSVSRRLLQAALTKWGYEVLTTADGKEAWAALQVTDHLEALCTLSLSISGPDKLGIVMGAYGLAGVRYRWATGEPTPKFPWQGAVIP